MTIIYTPAGRAREYCELAVNLYRGCNHNCAYCYAPAATRVKPEEFAKQTPRVDIIEKLRKEAGKTPGKGQQVMLSFTSDCYGSADREHKLTRQAIEILKAAGYRVAILTKAGLNAARDFDLLGEGDHVGATLTFISNDDSAKWEPGAALPEDRMNMLRAAKEEGLYTWASLEPVMDPAQSLEIIRQTAAYTDLYKVGKLNYHSAASGVDWQKFTKEAIALLEKHGKEYYIKESLRKYLKQTA